MRANRRQDDLRDPEHHERLAHVLRRCGFGPAPGLVGRWSDVGVDGLIDELLAAEPATERSDADLFVGITDDDDQAREQIFRLSLDQMMDLSNPLQERMTWYWQTHFTTSAEASDFRFAWRQYHLIRRLALGNFVELARALTTDAAMLIYLDGADSYGYNPNENYAREFLELFTLGHDGGYTEEDVRAAAHILAGWHVDWDTAQVSYDEESAYTRPVTFMGERRRWTLDSFIEFVCRQPACAAHVATRIYHHLAGPDLTDTRRDELASVFRSSGLDIAPLVAEIVRGADFMAAIHSRARQPVEWLLGALQACGYESVADVELQPWQLGILGQVPYLPPNVAGWPLDDRWTSASQVIARTSVMLDWQLPESTIDSVAPTVDAVLERCGIYTPSSSTRAALDAIEASFSEYDRRLELLFVTALTSPEFALL